MSECFRARPVPAINECSLFFCPWEMQPGFPGRSSSEMETRPQSWRDMSAEPRVFIAVVVLCGTIVLTYSMLHGGSENPLKFSCYLAIALVASRLKVNLPGITGTMSVNFLFLLLGVLELSLSEAMVLGCAAVVVQCLGDRPIPLQVAFSICSTALAVAATFAAYHYSLSLYPMGNTTTLLFLATCVYFRSEEHTSELQS